MHKMIIIVIRENIDKISGFPDIVLGDIYYKPNEIREYFRNSKKTNLQTLTKPN